MNPTYFRYEFLRLSRNKRFFFFSLVFPLVLFLDRRRRQQEQRDRLRRGPASSSPLYYMVGMAGYGAMMAAIAGGARIAAERRWAGTVSCD